MIYENIKVAGPKDYFRIKFKMTAACKIPFWKKTQNCSQWDKAFKKCKAISLMLNSLLLSYYLHILFYKQIQRKFRDTCDMYFVE